LIESLLTRHKIIGPDREEFEISKIQQIVHQETQKQKTMEDPDEEEESEENDVEIANAQHSLSESANTKDLKDIDSEMELEELNPEETLEEGLEEGTRRGEEEEEEEMEEEELMSEEEGAITFNPRKKDKTPPPELEQLINEQQQ
jgi:hypothetical protein